MSASESKTSSPDVCEACGAVVPGAKAGCLRMFEETIAKEFTDYRYGSIVSCERATMKKNMIRFST